MHSPVTEAVSQDAGLMFIRFSPVKMPYFLDSVQAHRLPGASNRVVANAVSNVNFGMHGDTPQNDSFVWKDGGGYLVPPIKDHRGRAASAEPTVARKRTADEMEFDLDDSAMSDSELSSLLDDFWGDSGDAEGKAHPNSSQPTVSTRESEPPSKLQKTGSEPVQENKFEPKALHQLFEKKRPRRPMAKPKINRKPADPAAIAERMARDAAKAELTKQNENQPFAFFSASFPFRAQGNPY